MEPVHNLLSPRVLIEGKDKSYSSVTELMTIVSKPNCNNIAITGTFGSGKSSILRTLEKVDTNHKYLNVSLATLDKSQKDIEYSIVQQLIYKADEDKIHQSRFSRIKYIEPKNLNCLSLIILLLIIAIVIAFEPSWLQVEGVYNFYNYLFGYSAGYVVNILFDILSVAYIFYSLFWIALFATKNLYNAKLSKLNIKEGSIDLSWGASVFNKHLDEIFHFFKATDYNVVIFEDLDRLENPKKLFLKLREINHLINDCQYFKGRKKIIKFIYAIKDEVFESENRTKYFDYIVSAIPIVNSINAGDYSINEYGANDKLKDNKCLLDISTKQYLELCGYIDGMRELNNIVNETIQYKNQIGENLADHKLFAITLYKNKYPEDYAKLHDKSGILYKSIEAKKEFIEIANRKSVQEINELNTRVLESKVKISDIRQLYVDRLQSDRQMTALDVNGRRVDLDDIKDDDDAFYRLTNDIIYTIYVKDEDGEKDIRQKYDLKFKDIEESVNPDEGYKQSISEYENKINDLSFRINILRHNINTIKRSLLSTIISKIENGEDSLNVILSIYKSTLVLADDNISTHDLQMCRMILFLLRNDYVDEHYSSFISYFHSGSLLESDNDYLQSLMLGISKGYEYELKDTSVIIQKMQVEYFDKKDVLNYCLLDGLMQNQEENALLLEHFCERVKENIDFIKGYNEAGMCVKEFFEYLLAKWNGFLDMAFDPKNIQYKEIFLVIFYQHCTHPFNFLKNKEQLNETFSIIVNSISLIDLSRVKSIISSLNIQFKELVIRDNDDAQGLYNYVLSGGRFEINHLNLNLIFGNGFNNHSYTTILGFENNDVKEYLQKNIKQSILNFPETSVSESREAMAELLNNVDLTPESKIEYINKQELKFDSLQDVEDKYSYILFHTDHIMPSWNNILDSYVRSDKKITDYLRSYIERHSLELEKEKVVSKEGDSTGSLFTSLFADNTLIIDSYKQLIFQFNYHFGQTDLSALDADRMSILIGAKKIKYTSDRVIDIQTRYSSRIFADFVISKFDEFLSEEDNKIEVNNEVGLYILQSTLTLTKKIEFLNNIASLVIDEEYSIDYANEICFYYAEAGINEDSDVDLINGALSRADNWSNKIRVINSINQNLGYDSSRAENMLNMMGGEYIKLNLLRKHSKFDNNAENLALITLLDSENHISSYSIVDGIIKVVGRYP